jgi:hypothetical protein
MALVLNHQTPAEFAARFWTRCQSAYYGDRSEFERLIWWIWSRIQAGDLTSDQVRLSFNAHFGRSMNTAQWNSFVTSRLVPIKDRYLARLNEAEL